MKQFKILSIIILLFTVLPLSAQTFQVTDMQFGNSISEYTKQKKKSQGLGSMAKLSVFDNDAKLELMDSEGKIEGNIILEKQADGNFVYKEGAYRIILKIESILGYYKALKIETWEDKELLWTTYLKRK